MRAVLFFTGRHYHPPFDEGVKLVARHLHLELARRTRVLMATTASAPPEGCAVVPNRPLGFFRAVRRLSKAHRPEAVLYLPDALLDRHTLIRCGLLRRAAGGVRTAMVTLMPAAVGPAVRVMLRLWRPDVVFSATDAEADLYRRRGVRHRLFPPAVDAERFRPPRDAAEKASLRRKYGLPEDAALCLHVGHFRRARNIEWLAGLDLPEGVRLVVVGRRSRPGEDDMTDALGRRGAVLLDAFLPDVQEVYRAADVYLFPVEHERSAIGMPLSVLEAMATGLPVVSTPFGGLVRCFDGVAGVYFAATREAFEDAVRCALAGPAPATRAAVESHGWGRLAADILEELEG